MFEVQQGKKLEKKLHKIKNKLITDRKKNLRMVEL